MIILKIILFILLAVLGIILLALCIPVRIEFSFIGEKVIYRLKYAFITIFDSEGGGLFGTKAEAGSDISHKREKPAKAKKGAELPETETVASNGENETELSEESVRTPEGDSKSELQEKPASITKSEEGSGMTDGNALEEADRSEEATNEKKKEKSLGEKVGFLMDIWSSAKRPIRKILRGFHIGSVYIDFLVADEDAYKCAIKYGRVCTALYNGLALCGNIFTVKYKTVDVECGFGKDKSRWDAGCKVFFLPITAVIAGIWFLITYIFKMYLPGKTAKRESNNSAEKQNAQPQGGM